jgi:serine/threonine protein phosphatase PrpC
MLERDIVVMGTDGLFDNVFDDDLKPCLVKENIENPNLAAKCIGDFAYTKSHDKRYESPFAVGAK